MKPLATRALNRSLLARQRLLERVRMPVADLVEHLVGVQAQEPRDPYITMWTRLADFDPLELSGLLERRKAVRASLMRSTIHLVTARDCLALRPLVQSRLERTFYGQAWRRAVDGVDVEPILAFGRSLLDEAPRTTSELRAALRERFPDVDADATTALVKYIVPAVQVPPRGLWGRSATPAWASIEHWLGRPPHRRPSVAAMFTRYLAAFGPATPADFRNWSGLTGQADVIDRLRPKLLVYTDEVGRELLDVPEAPFPDPDMPAPVRFYGDFDNVFLGHADRTRIVEGPTFRDGTVGRSSFSVDGFLAGTWKLERKRGVATVLIEPWRRLRRADRTEIEREAHGLVCLLVPDATSVEVGFV